MKTITKKESIRRNKIMLKAQLCMSTKAFKKLFDLYKKDVNQYSNIDISDFINWLAED